MNTLAKLLVPISAAALGVGVTFVVSAAPDDAPAADAAAAAQQPADTMPPSPAAADAPPAPAPAPAPTSENPPAPESASPPPPVTPTESAPAPAEPAPAAPPTPADAAPAPAEAVPVRATQPATAPADPVLAAAQSVLAQRFVELARQTVREAKLDPAALHQGELLLRAATKLEPRDAQTWQLLVEAAQRTGDREEAFKALQEYRKLAPGDLVAQSKMIEMYASRFETADAELAYLRGLAGKETIHPWVRSQVNVMIAQRLLDRGEPKAAVAVVDEAIKQNSVNVAALQLKYELMLNGEAPASAADRAKALLALVQANPLRPAALAEVGRLLASVGMGKDAGEWMNRALALYPKAPDSSPQAYHDLVIDYVSSLYLGGQLQAARNAVESLIKNDPSDPSAWFLQLVLDSADKDALAKSREGAAVAMAANWARAAQFIANGGNDATTQPAATEPAAAAAAAATQPAVGTAGAPEPGEVATQVAASNDAVQQSTFIQAATDYAWFEIYFNEQPAAAQKWVDALAQVLPPENVTLQRLRGWMLLSDKKFEDARQALGPIRDFDPLAALGMLRVEAAAGPAATAPAAAAEPAADAAPAPEPAAAEPSATQPSTHAAATQPMTPDDAARALLEDYRSGLVGAILASALKDRNLKPAPHTDASAIREQLKNFPRGWLDVSENPQRYYSVRVEPTQIGYRFGEPMYVIVQLQNLTNLDIPIGEDGVIKPSLWFDVDVVSTAPRPFRLYGTAYEQIGMSPVLPAKTKLPPIYVRLDQGGLEALLERGVADRDGRRLGGPIAYLQLTGYVTTNVTMGQNGPVPALGGFQVPFAKKLIRRGFPIAKPGQLQQAFQELEQGFPDMKIRSLRTLGACLDRLGAAAAMAPKPAEPGAAPADAELPQRDAVAGALANVLDRMAKATEDETPGVAEWARFELGRRMTPDRARVFIEALLNDPRWEGRLLGVIAARSQDRAAAMELIGKLAQTDADEIVKSFAAEQLDLLDRAPADAPDAAAPAPVPAPAEPQPK